MEIQLALGAIQEAQAELIVVNLFQGVTTPGGAAGAVDQALHGAIADLIALGDFTGKVEQTAALYTRGAIPARRVLIVGLGEQAQFNLDVLRRVAGATARAVRKMGVRTYTTILPGAGGISPELAAQTIVEGTILGAYSFDELKSEPSEPQLEALTVQFLAREQEEAVGRGVAAGQAIAEATCLARDLVNAPGNFLTPTTLAERVEEMANDYGLHYDVLDEAQMAELGMGALLGVAQGSDEPAKFIILEHNADRAELPTYVVVGKGITFDSGGISLKPAEHMEQMKDDMSGAAITVAVLRAAAALQLPLHVVGLLPATENLPGGRAYKPGDVLRSMAGITIEVISTDAEGRLILADALAYARRYNPRAVVDLATLTGACVIALGNITTGLMGNNPELVQAIRRAAQTAGEKTWELPLFEEYDEQIKSDVADIKNVGGRPAGAITAGMFLARFAKEYPWAHLDIAGTAWSEETKGWIVKGATAQGVRTLVEWLRQVSAGQA